MFELVKNIPVIIVILPLLLGIISFILDKHKISILFYSIYSVIFFVLSLVLARYVKTAPGYTMLYQFGNFSQSIGISFEANPLSSYCIVFLATCNLIYVAFLLLGFLQATAINIGLYLCVIAALCGVSITNDMFNFYVFIELASISSYILSINSKDKASYPSALNYLTVGSIAGCLILLGTGFLYASFGTLNITEIRESINQAQSFGDLILYSLILIITGILIKTGIMPFHRWYFNINKHSIPTNIAFFSFTNSSVMLLMIVKMIYLVYGVNFVFSMTKYTFNIIYILAIYSIVVGSIKAINTKTLSKFIVWSTISQAGYLTIGFLTDNELILIGSFMQILSNAISKIILLSIYQITYNRYTGLGLVKIKIFEKCDFSGIRIPIIFILLNMAGLPMTIGFISKIYIIIGCVSEERINTLIVIIIGSILSLIYVIKLIEPVIMGNKSNPSQEVIYISQNRLTRIVFLLIAFIIIVLPFNKQFNSFNKVLAHYLLTI